MSNRFIIHRGELVFEEDCLLIKDGQPAWFRIASIVSLIAIMLYGVLVIIKYFRGDDSSDLWIGVTIISLGIPAMIVQSKISYDSKIEYKHIRSIKIRRNLTDQLLADILLNNRKKRRIVLDSEDLGRFGRDHLDKLIEEFNDKQVQTIPA
ncbi:MAG: hypothetical protein KBB24_02145 [Bacteroidales bacterium]|jgi:hypothetical protein|nr:hypothetical protein [Bacteroidales bacterium]MDX9927557.1 hypothetical protein [Bacteroidales bacterium]HNX82799.1 hypothetical protein [Bacteroidales bacterium]HOC47920.1 hypothetical protein [Bacteroidales bacterium]HPS96634.1 hypothetical protein [Bacteroidales bacterium]